MEFVSAFTNVFSERIVVHPLVIGLSGSDGQEGLRLWADLSRRSDGNLKSGIQMFALENVQMYRIKDPKASLEFYSKVLGMT